MISIELKNISRNLEETINRLPTIRINSLSAGLEKGVSLLRDRVRFQKLDSDGNLFGTYKRDGDKEDEKRGDQIDFYDSGTLLNGLKIVEISNTNGESILAIEPPQIRIIAIQQLKKSGYNVISLSKQEKTEVYEVIKSNYFSQIKL